jgi:hypothetical protein
MKRLIGATALAIVGLSYSAQAADPEPVTPEPELQTPGVYAGMDAKDHPGYGGVTPAVVFELPQPTGCCDHWNVRPAVNMPSGPMLPCVSGFVNRVPC